jgi:hypothetical protein
LNFAGLEIHLTVCGNLFQCLTTLVLEKHLRMSVLPILGQMFKGSVLALVTWPPGILSKQMSGFRLPIPCINLWAMQMSDSSRLDSSVSRPISANLSVYEMPAKPDIIWTILVCTFSIHSMSVLFQGDQAGVLNSKWGRT